MAMHGIERINLKTQFVLRKQTHLILFMIKLPRINLLEIRHSNLYTLSLIKSNHFLYLLMLYTLPVFDSQISHLNQSSSDKPTK